MHINITYDVNFTELMLYLKSKYGQKLFDLDGIGSQLDIDKFSKGFFINSSTTADVSVDSNSNVSTKDMIVYNTELPKPYFRMNAYYLIWKKLRQLYGHVEANRIIEMQLTGDFYINDLHGVSMPYSYHPYTKLIVKINNKLKNISMVELFSKFKNNVKILSDCEVIDTEKLNIKILDKGSWIKLNRVLRHRSHTDLIKINTPTGAVCVVTEDHPVILSDGSEKRADTVTVDDVLLYEVRPPEEVIDSYGIMLCDRDAFIGKNVISKLSWKNEWVYDVTTETGTFYSNGLTVHNCYNYSTYDIALAGLTMVNKIKSIPPKHLYSFKSQLEQFVVLASNSTLGAVGLADWAIVTGYYVDKILETKSDAGFRFETEKDCWKYVKENIVSFIYTINQPSRSSQSPFTNISLFDDGFLNSLASEYVFSDGKVPKIETIKKIQELFIDTMNDELRRTPVTFPVTTACFSVDDEGNVLDETFLEMISEKNMEFGFINIYCGKTSTLSSCCRLRSDTNSEYFNSFGSGSSKIGCYDDKTEVLTSNGWKLFKDVDINSDKIYTMDEYKNPSFDKASEYHEYDYEGDLISFKNKSTDLLVTPNHRMVLDSKKTDKIFIKRADEIESNLQVSIPMSLPYNSLVVEELHFTIPSLKIKNKSYPEVKINYNDWVKFMGIYLSEGCCDKAGNKNNHGNERYRITINQSKEAKPAIYNEIYKLLEKLPYKFYAFDNGFEINNKPLCLYLRQFGDHSDKFVPEDIKYLPKQYLDSFWEWLVKGDGNITSTGTEMYWTTSKQLNDDIQMIMTLMGYRSRSEIVEKKDATISGRLISKENMKDCYRSIKYIRTNNTVKKRQISRKLYSGKVYCLSVPNGTLFVRRNGKVAWSGNSLGVVTVNLPRLAYRYKDNEDGFFEALEDTVEVVAKVNNSKRHIIKRRIENGAQPLYDLGFMDINKQYSTCGLNGINEAITIMGYDVLHNGGVDFGLKMLDVINTTNDRLQKQYKAPHNCEQTPSENSSIKLANKDKLLGIDLGYNLYSNQFIPLTTKADLLDRIKLQGIFDKHFSGGSILHLNIEERITEKEHIMELIRSCAKKGVIYFAINYNLQRCEDFHMTVGRNNICSICGKPIEENFTRVVGFLTSVKNWHRVRREEDYPERQFYNKI